MKLEKPLLEDLKDFLENAHYLITDDIGATVIKGRITRLYNRLVDPQTPINQLASIYKLLAAYALLGMKNAEQELNNRITTGPKRDHQKQVKTTKHNKDNEIPRRHEAPLTNVYKDSGVR